MKLRAVKSGDENTFYGHGKLLITGEYFVLDGAKALAVPVKFGQSLRIKELHSAENILYWVALNSKNQMWLNLVFDTTDFSCINSKEKEAATLTKILRETRKLKPAFLSVKNDFAVETHLEFPNEWGLGSSSTLIHCISQWAKVDSYKLLRNTVGGSGYDVACSGSSSPILYQLENGNPEIWGVDWEPPFTESVYFAYTGQKKLSSDAIKYYREKISGNSHITNELTRITEQILWCSELGKFERLLNEHENIIASHLKMMKMRDTLFADYWGTVKSLGAWGGDFVMLTHDRDETELFDYLKAKNVKTVFGWKDLILNARQSL